MVPYFARLFYKYQWPSDNNEPLPNDAIPQVPRLPPDALAKFDLAMEERTHVTQSKYLWASNFLLWSQQLPQILPAPDVPPTQGLDFVQRTTFSASGNTAHAVSSWGAAARQPPVVGKGAACSSTGPGKCKIKKARPSRGCRPLLISISGLTSTSVCISRKPPANLN